MSYRRDKHHDQKQLRREGFTSSLTYMLGVRSGADTEVVERCCSPCCSPWLVQTAFLQYPEGPPDQGRDLLQ